MKIKKRVKKRNPLVVPLYTRRSTKHKDRKKEFKNTHKEDEFEVSTDGRYIFIGGIQIDTDPEIEEDGDWYDDYNDEQWYNTGLESQ